MNRIHFIAIPFVAVSLLAGCGSSREVEITGEAKAAATVNVTGPISIEFFDVIDPAKPTDTSLAKLSLDKLGPFTQKVDAEGSTIHIVALNDLDKNGACTEGEAWAQADAAVKDDGTVDAVSLVLDARPCPAAAAK